MNREHVATTDLSVAGGESNAWPSPLKFKMKTRRACVGGQQLLTIQDPVLQTQQPNSSEDGASINDTGYVRFPNGVANSQTA